jgi:RHS repeat-associated protein
VIAEVASGQTTASMCYDGDFEPYGGEHAYTNTCSQNYKFTGKERDTESGLDNFGARYNASTMGRFMTPDPMGGHLEDPQTLNRYAYVRNNPLSLTDPTGLDSYLTCQQASSTCQSQTVGYDKNGNAQTALVQGVTNADKSFTATQIGNNPDGSGGLVDKTTGTGNYTASVNGSGVQFSNNGGQTSSSGVFVNGTPQTTFQDAGFANGGALSGFSFTLTNSKMEANQTEAGTFTFAGNQFQAGLALEKAGINWMGPVGANWGSDEFRSWGTWTGANSAHFNVDRAKTDPWSTVPASGNMHFGEHNPVQNLPAHIYEAAQ